MEIENEVTIATHNGSQVARQHNLRNPKVIAKEDHIDPNGHFEVWLAKLLGFVTENDGIYEMTLKGAFYYHYYENFYTLSYIDKMWGIMRKQAFPKEIKL